jgi:heptosyltransferase III
MIPASILPNLPHQARILVVRLRSIGDIILLTPAFQLLKEWRPDFRISVVVEARFHQLLEGNPDVEELLHPGEGKGWRKVASRVRAVREVRRREFSLCVNLHGGPTSTFLTRSSGAQWKAGFHHYRALSVYNIVIPDARTILGRPTLHTAEHQASAFFWLGLGRQPVPPARLWVAPHCRTWWDTERERLGISRNQEYAVIHPVALYATKQWAPENFAQVGAALERDAAIVPVYSCGPDESAVLDAVERAAAAPIRRLQDASLGEFAAALSGARLFVGNDSGPAHMAAALGRPSAVIFGSSSSLIWGPWPPPAPGRPSQVVQNPYECNPCPGDHCYRFERPECILSVTVPQVRAAIESVLEKSGAESRGCR